MDHSQENQIIGFSLLVDKPAYMVTDIPQDPPPFDINGRRTLFEKLQTLMQSPHTDAPSGDLHETFRMAIERYKQVKESLHELILQDHGGLGIANELWDRYADNIDGQVPQLIGTYRSSLESAFHTTRRKNTGIKWRNHPSLMDIHKDVSKAFASGERYFAVRNFYSEALKNGFKSFRDLEEAAEFTFMRNLQGDYYGVYKSAVALQEIEHTIKLNMALKQPAIKQRTARRQGPAR